MVSNQIQAMTITTSVSNCDPTVIDINRTVNDLQILYQNVSSLFLNISIINFNCNHSTSDYFEQIIVFTHQTSVRIQVLFASIYYEYINANNFLLNGFLIDRERFITLSSAAVNNSYTTDVCSSAEIAGDPLCLTNMTRSVCNVLSNPWNFNCSDLNLTNATSSTDSLESVIISTGLGSWQIGLISSLSILFVFSLVFLSGFLYRRCKRSKRLALSSMNLHDDTKIMQKTGIPQGQAFQRAATVLQPKHSNHTGISWINDSHSKQTTINHGKYIDISPPAPYNQVTFVDHAKVYDPGFPRQSLSPICMSTAPLTRKESNSMCRPISGSSVTQLKLMMNERPENEVNKFDTLPSSTLKKSCSSMSRQYTNPSFLDDNLTDEDAWMSILDVVHAELAKLNEQERTKATA